VPPKLLLPTLDAEGISGWQVFELAKNSALHRDGGQHEVAGNVFFVYLGAGETQRVQALRHRSEGKAVCCGSIVERTLSGVISSQE
jgi:hypothetical protein